MAMILAFLQKLLQHVKSQSFAPKIMNKQYYIYIQTCLNSSKQLSVFWCWNSWIIERVIVD